MPEFNKGDLIKVKADYGWPGTYRVIECSQGGTFVEPLNGARRPFGDTFRTDAIELAEASELSFKEYLETGIGDTERLMEFCSKLKP